MKGFSGMKQLLVSSQIDYVTITRNTLNTPVHGVIRHNRIEAALRLIENDLLLPIGTHWAPRLTNRHYQMTFTNPETGITVDVPHDKDEIQGLRIVAPGGSWLMRSVKSLRAMLSKGWRPTRVDHCWNVQGADFDILKMYLDWRENSPKSGILKPDIEGDKEHGETFTIGSRKSDFYVRIYDKEKESNLSTGSFLRFECELKGDYVKKLYEDDFEHVDATADEMYKKAGFYSGFPVLHSVLKNISSEVTQTGEIVVGRKITNREKWIRTQVLPGFRNLAIEDPEGAVEIAEIFMAIATNRE